MAYKFSRLASVLALGAAFLVMPALLDTTSPFAINSAFAKQGGNGNGNGNGGNGNGGSGNGGSGNGNANGSTSKSEKSTSTKSATTQKDQKTVPVAKGILSTELGALNAATASAKAFANASPDSRIGKIKAYYDANQAALTARAVADETDAVTTRSAFENSALPSVVASYEALQADPANPALQAIYNQVATDAVLTGEQIAAVESTYAEWRGALEADTIAANAASEAEAALNAAANKTAVSIETRTALDALLAGKFN